VLRHGGPIEADVAALRSVSRATGTAAAFLFDVPNQPLFESLEEDPLLAYSFSQYLRTGDESWPLLFPMVKSVVGALDVVQAVGHARGGAAIVRYVVAGHSKRGQTAWLSGAADSRVKGIIPIANDVLDSRSQITHHRAIAGEISLSSQIFNEVIEAADSPRGRCLMQMIDPFSYRDRLTEPKLVVLGTNDDYTPTDALNLYWDDLAGPKSVLYLPNTTHAGTNYHREVNPTAFAFVRAVASEAEMPAMEWSVQSQNGVAEARVTTDVVVRSARLWTSTSANRDFRDSEWRETAMRALPGSVGSVAEAFVGEVPLPSAGFAALFAEVEFEGDGAPFKLSTQIRVVEPAPTPAFHHGGRGRFAKGAEDWPHLSSFAPSAKPPRPLR
jgi:PhoPQ-activated pathogenicity-related protein